MAIILGAGMAGLLAGALDRRATVLEAQKYLPNNHGAVLRFRTNRIGEALNIPFRHVSVVKAIWEDGREVPLTPARMNRYSTKCVGAVVSRSLSKMETAPVERYVAPADFIPQMAALVGDRLQLGVEVDRFILSGLERPLISTMPLPKLLGLLDWPADKYPGEFTRAHRVGIWRFRVPDADVFQTVYFPAPNQQFYRGSITGDELMLEAVTTNETVGTDELTDALEAFGLRPHDVEDLGWRAMPLGKIVELPSAARKALLGKITREHRIWSLGRYACWRNCLLDDVLDDFYRIREMMALSPYDLLRRQT
jgi:hypothetical protein